MIAGALVLGLALGVGTAFLTGVGHFGRNGNGTEGQLSYETSREASSELEPQRHPRKRDPLPKLQIAPGTDLAQPRLPTTGSAAPPPIAGSGSGPESQTASLPPKAETPVAPLPAWQRNAPHIALEPGKPMIAIVIDDLGMDRVGSARAVRLPAAVTLTYLPYADHLKEQTEAALKAGHELLVHMPMEPKGKGADPGPNALLVSLTPQEIRRRLDWALGRFQGYVGINNHMGSLFTSNAADMDIVLEDLKSRGLLFLDSRTAGSSVGYKQALALGVPTAVRQVFLDDTLTRKAVDYRLREVEERAQRLGHAIAIGHPHKVTLEALEAWLPTLAAKGFQLAPVSAMVDVPREGEPGRAAAAPPAH